MPADIAVLPVAEAGLVGRLHQSASSTPTAGVLVLGGAEGGCDRVDGIAHRLASEGLPAFALAYFAAPGLPPLIDSIPLEYFHRALGWLGARPGIDAARLGVLGGSKGGEAALLIASTTSVRAVVAYVPSHVSWQALNWTPPPRSSWQWRDQPIPFVQFAVRADLTRPRGLMEFYAASLAANPEAVHAAEIPVERSRAALLLISGGDDGVWPSSAMSRCAMDRLRSHAYAYPYEHVDYADAGHAIMGPDPAPSTIDMSWGVMQLGGTDAENASARENAWHRTLRWLRQYLQ